MQKTPEQRARRAAYMRRYRAEHKDKFREYARRKRERERQEVNEIRKLLDDAERAVGPQREGESFIDWLRRACDAMGYRPRDKGGEINA